MKPGKYSILQFEVEWISKLHQEKENINQHYLLMSATF